MLVSGDAGVGKTRLLTDLATTAERDGALVLTGRCVGSGAGLPYLRSSGGGAVVIISSITGMRPAPRTTYAVAKAAEIQLAATAAAELAADKIRVNAVSPGSIFFPGGSWDRFSQENPADFAAFLGTQFPLGRLGRIGRSSGCSPAGRLAAQSRNRGGDSRSRASRPSGAGAGTS